MLRHIFVFSLFAFSFFFAAEVGALASRIVLAARQPCAPLVALALRKSCFETSCAKLANYVLPPSVIDWSISPYDTLDFSTKNRLQGLFEAGFAGIEDLSDKKITAVMERFPPFHLFYAEQQMVIRLDTTLDDIFRRQLEFIDSPFIDDDNRVINYAAMNPLNISRITRAIRATSSFVARLPYTLKKTAERIDRERGIHTKIKGK